MFIQHPKEAFFMNEQFDYTQAPTYNDNGFIPTEQEPKKNGLATAALVLGIISLVFGCCCSCCFLIIPVLATIAIVLAVLSKNGNDGVMPGKAKAGLILAIIALVLFVIYLAIFGYYALNPEKMDPYFEEAYGMTFEEYWGYVGSMDEYDTLPSPNENLPIE